MIDILIGLLILSSIIAPIAIYKRSKSLKFRLIEHRIYKHPSIEFIFVYTPQVRIEGIWYNIIFAPANSERDTIAVNNHFSADFLDSHDAIALIDQFKSAGNFTIPSNRKLNSNEKQIIVE